MIIESIALFIFVSSFGGVLYILVRKMPALTVLPHNGTTGIKKHHIILHTENKIKDVFIYFEKQIFMHKFLSFVKVLTLKIETRIDHSLHKIRKKAKEVDRENKAKK